MSQGRGQAGESSGISPAAARWLLELGLRDLKTRVTRDGLAIGPHVEPALQLLAAAADADLPAIGSASGTPVASVGVTSEWVTASRAADLTGKSDSYVRRLARDREVRAVRHGRDWLIDIDSLRTVLRKKAA